MTKHENKKHLQKSMAPQKKEKKRSIMQTNSIKAANSIK